MFEWLFDPCGRRRWFTYDVQGKDVTVDAEYVGATLRWIEHNRKARLKGCPCGKRGTRVHFDGRNNGAVPVEWWTCDEHEGATGWRGTTGCSVTPLYDRFPACGDCVYAGGSKYCGGYSRQGDVITSYSCPDKPEEDVQ